MSNAQAVAFLSFGLIVSGGGGNYPSADDVRLGVAYDTGLTGNLVLPTVGNVLQGVSYGANGTEYTGTFLSPLPPTPPVTPSNSPTIQNWLALYAANTAMNGVQTVCIAGTSAVAAIVSEMTEDEILAAGGTAENGGYNIQMLASRAVRKPQKFDSIQVYGPTIEQLENLQVFNSNLNNGVIYCQAADFVASET